MSRATARRGLSALLALACAAAALLTLHEQPAPSRAPAFALAADGALTLQSDRHGVAILQAAGMRPGDVAEGVADAVGERRGRAHAARGGRRRAAGHGRRAAVRAARARDRRRDRPAQPVAVFSGTFAEASAVALGPLPAGAERRYRFRVTFPAGAGDNALQGAALTARFVWTAVAAAPQVRRRPPRRRHQPPRPRPPPRRPHPTPTPTATPTPTPTPGAAARHRLTPRPDLTRSPPRPASPASPPRAAASSAAATRSRQAARRRARHRRPGLRRQPQGPRRPQAAQGEAQHLKHAEAPVRVSVRVVVKTTAGTVTVTRAYRVCRR